MIFFVLYPTFRKFAAIIEMVYEEKQDYYSDYCLIDDGCAKFAVGSQPTFAVPYPRWRVEQLGSNVGGGH